MSFVEKRSVTHGGAPQIELESKAKNINSNLDQNEPIVEENQIIPKYLFTSDNDGYLKQWDIKQRKLVKNWGKIHLCGIISITATNDGRYLFAAGSDCILKQWDIEQQKLMKDYGEIHAAAIGSITATNDGRY